MIVMRILRIQTGLYHLNHLDLSCEIPEHVSESDFTGTTPSNHMPFLRHNTNEPELPAALILVLVRAAGRDVGIGSGFDGVVFAVNVQ
jgi:hypothetical protein